MAPSNFGYSIKEALSHFKRNLSSSLGAVVTIFLSLFIIGLFVLGSAMINSMVGGIENQVTIRAFIDDSAEQLDIDTFEKTVSSWDNVQNVSFTNKEQALSEYNADMSNTNAADALEALDNENPLPASFTIELTDPSLVESTAQKLLSEPTYTKIADRDNPSESVRYGQGEVERLFTFTNYIRLAAVVLVGLLTFVAFIFINNTIRLSITARQREIAIMRMVGASNSFIRGPFITEGVFQALLGACLSVGVLEIARNLVFPALYAQPMFSALDIPLKMYLITYVALAAVGMLIGLFGSAIAMRRYLKA